MNNPLSVSVLTRSVWRDFRRAWRALVIYQVLFKLLEAWLLVPAIALLLTLVLSRAGHVAVSNRDIVDFLLSPPGMLYAGLFSTTGVALLLLEQAGIMVLAARAASPERQPIKRMLLAIFPKTLAIAQLSAVYVGLCTLTFAPFLLLAFLTYRVFLSEHDIYFYLKERPPVFWLAAGIGGILLLAALTLALWLYVRWALALPILLFEKKFAAASMRASRERVRGVSGRVGLYVLGWLGGALLLGMGLAACFRLLARAVLETAGERSIPLILLLLVAQAGLLTALSVLTVVGQGLLTRRLYVLRSEQLGLLPSEVPETSREAETPVSPWARRLVYLALAIVLLTPLALWAGLPQQLRGQPLVHVTAHRGHARAAPENTLSAIQKAIESGADYAEVDVHQTADGVIVLLHDRDLKRVAGVSRRLEDLSLDEVRKLDVGSWFARDFVGERVPTLEEAIRLCRGRIKMNIELKVFGQDRQLAQAVARLLREQDFEAECLVTSLDYEALQEVKRYNPRLRTGLIIAHSLGDVNRIEVDALSVRADFLSEEVLHAAHRLGREVHVWTVNDSRQMIRLMKRGVDNIITSDPDLAIRVRAEWAGLTEGERLLLASRLLLGLDP